MYFPLETARRGRHRTHAPLSVSTGIEWAQQKSADRENHIPDGRRKAYVARVINPDKRAGQLNRYSLAQIPPGNSPNPRFPGRSAGGNKK